MTTQTTATTNVKLVSTGKLAASLKDAHSKVVNLSIMAAYYTVISGDVRFMSEWCKLDAALISKAIRPLMAVKWSKKEKVTRITSAGVVVDGKYISDAKKRTEICELLDVVPNNSKVEGAVTTTWPEFYAKAMDYYRDHKDAAAKADLDSDEDNRQFFNRLAGMLEKALEHGVSTHDLSIMVERVKAGKEIVRKTKPSADDSVSE